MSVPAWKKAIMERRKKAEDEEKKKQAEEEAYLATLPPWKRALFQKRERERLEKEKAAAGTSGDAGNAVQRNSSFQNRQAAQQQQEKAAKGPGGWSRRVTPPSSSSSERRATSPTSPHDSSHHFFPATTSSSSSSTSSAGTKWDRRRRSSVTALPGVDEPIAAKVASAPAPQPAPSVTQRPRSMSESSAVSGKKVVSSFMKLNQSQPTNEMPAWKKALLERRKEKERAAAGGGPKPTDNSSSSTSASVDSLSLTRKESPPGIADEPASALAMKRRPSPVEGVVTAPPEPTPLGLQRKPSPVEHTKPNEKSTNVGGKPAERGHTDPKNSEPKPLGLARKASPVESVAVSGTKWSGTQRSSGLTSETTHRGPETSSGRKSPTSGVIEPKRKESKPVPSRTAPVAPNTTTAKKSEPSQKSSTKQQQVSLSHARQRSAPEIVNRRGGSEPTPQHSQALQAEGVVHHAPVYREVSEWANVSEEDERFQKLPMWKQALIRRRRTDIAKRMGHTTSVDDVLLANGPVPSNNQQGNMSITSDNQNTRGVRSEDRSGSIPAWKKQKMQRKSEGGLTGPNLMSAHENKQLQPKREPPTGANTNIKALLGRFTPSPPPHTSTTVPKVTITSRSPSPSSSSTSPPPHPTSSRPPPSSAGVPPVSTSGRTTRKTFTWTPGEDTMPGDALSDDSSGEDDEEEGEYNVTNLDDTSEEEEEEEEGEGGESSGVVLLRPPQTIISSSTTDIPSASISGEDGGAGRVRKTSSILVLVGRSRKKPLRRVAFSENDLTVEHYYPKYDYGDYEETQNDDVSTGFSFSFWKSREQVEATDGTDEQNGLSQRVHPSLRSPESDPDNYRYSSRDSAHPGHTPPSMTSPSVKTTTITLSNYKPSILSSYGGGEDVGLQESYTNAMENGTKEEEEGGEEEVDDSGHLMPADGVPNFYASLSSDTAAMLW